MAKLVLHRTSLRQFTGPMLLYAAGCLAAAAVAWAAGSTWLPLLFLVGIMAALWTWRMIKWPDRWSSYISFGAILLLLCALNRCFYLADYFVNGTQFDKWPFFVQSPQTAVFKGEVIAIVGTLLTVLGWRLCGGMRVSPSVIMDQPRHNYRVMQVIYVLSLAGLLISEHTPRIASIFGQLLPALLGLGLVSTFLLPMTRLRSRLPRLFATMLLSVPFFAVASGTGMKTNIILALIPGVVMLWQCLRHPVARASLIVLGLLGLALVTSYINLYRTEVWAPQNHGRAISQTVPEDFMREIKRKGLPDTVGEGLDMFLKRIDGSYAHGWAISIADEQSYHPGLVFAPLAYVFIPRVLWPGKPLIEQGFAYSGLVFGQRYIRYIRSSTAAGFYPALYLGLGWPAVVLGALLIGAILAMATRIAQRFGGPLTAGLYIFALIPFMLHLNENWTVGALSGPLIGLVYVLAIVKLARWLTRILVLTRHSSMASR